MINALTEQLGAALAAFSGTTRLLELSIDGAAGALLVEAFAADDAIDEVGVRDVIALSTSTHLGPASMLGRSASLELSLADGSRTSFTGEVSEAAMLGSDGGFARYRIRISPWLWRLGQVRNSRVWQDKSVIEIVDDVFEPWLPLAKWRWSEDTSPFIADASPRSYCCQYRQSDLDFVRRLLAEEGLSWRLDDTELVIFADSTRPCAIPEDPSSAQDGGLRFHGVSAVEASDTVQALESQRRLHASLVTVLSSDYKARQSITGSAPSLARYGHGLPELEAYEVPGQYAYADRGQARRDADLRMQAREARGQLWRGRSTVRTLRAGARMTVTGAPRRELGKAAAFTVLHVWSVGVNNLPPPATQALAELFGPIPELLEEITGTQLSADQALVVERAVKSGYGNRFTAIPAELPWRPGLLIDDDPGLRKPTAFGAQSAIVVGVDGSDSPRGADELYCDRLGRVRIRFHWQEGGQMGGNATCWVRVAQRSAGGGMGSQFLPRIGQEVLVQFIENDIDRPIVVGALYNGRGEGGIVPTPGGQATSDSDTSCFAAAHDRRASGQGNRAGGHSPVWHGASADSGGHRNAGAQWGVRSKEFGGHGYNQLLFDDTDAQGRVQLRCTFAASELNLGHLIHAADNYRGSFRGLGAELRTDHYGAVRAGSGLLVSSYEIGHAAAARDPAGENAAGAGLLQQAVSLAESFSAAASTHLTVGLAAHLGAARANASVLDDRVPPLKAMHASVSAMVDLGDASEKPPHMADPIIAVSARDGFGANAGQSLQLANGETVTVMSGQDTQFVTGGQMRVHSGQAIGVLGGAVKAGEGGLGLQMLAAKEAIDIQAQGDELRVQARDEVNVISANAHIDWAAAKRISLSTAGGANITIEGGDILVQCPGKVQVNAGRKSFAGPATIGSDLPKLPRGTLQFDERFQLTDPAGDPLANVRYSIAKEGGGIIEGVTDAEGMIPLQQAFGPEKLTITILSRFGK